MIKLNKFESRKFAGFSLGSDGVLKKNFIKSFMGPMYCRCPQYASELTVQLLAAHRGPTLETFLSEIPAKTFETDDEYYWNVVGDSRRNYALVEARDADGNPITADSANVGVGGEMFYLVFAEDWIGDQEVVVGEANEIYPMMNVGVGRNEGTNVVYQVQAWGSVTDTGIPADQLLPGKLFSAEYAPVSAELSRKAGTISFSSPVAMRNEFSHIRIHTKVSGALINEKRAFGIPKLNEKTGKIEIVNLWMHEVQWELEKKWQDYKNNILAYGRSNRNSNGEYLNFDKSGEVIRCGSGLFEQMEVANTSFYSHFSLKRFMDKIYQISHNSKDFKYRKFLVKTGELGAIQFSRAALSEGSGWTPISYEYDANALGVLSQTKSKMTPFGGAYKMTVPQVTEFIAPNGCYVKIDVDRGMYDDPVRNKIQHPLGGPAMSYRYDIFDMGSQNEPNIFKCVARGQESDITGYEWGLRNPFTGQINNDNMSHDEDSATIHKMATLGICLLDPTATLSYIPDVLQ